jgi:hypothetical protein
MALVALLLISLAASGPAEPAPSVPADATIVEHECRVMVKDELGKLVVLSAPELHVLRGAAAEGAFAPSLPPRSQTIICYRNTVVPAANDDEVLALGMPLILAQAGEEGRIATLEISAGQYRLRFIKGTLMPGEQASVQSKLNLFQDRSQRGK